MAHSESEVTVAILNWNGLHHLKQFLPSVVSHSGQARVRVIDNASTDASVAWLRKNYPQVETDVLDRNHGFTGGYNLGIRHIETPLVVLLNSDVEVRPGWIQPLLQRMNQDARIAACQPKILSWNEPEKFEYAGASGGFLDVFGYPFCRGRIFGHCENDEGQYNDSVPVFWASGACMMVRKSDYENTGGLEPRFFAHMEEIDLCWRFWHRGKQVWTEPASEVLHLGAGTLAKSNPRKTYLNFRNGLAMLFVNTHGWKTMPVLFTRLVLDGMAGIQFLTGGQLMNCLAIIKGHFSFYASISYWIKKRNRNKKESVQEVPESVLLNGSIVASDFMGGRKKFTAIFKKDTSSL